MSIFILAHQTKCYSLCKAYHVYIVTCQKNPTLFTAFPKWTGKNPLPQTSVCQERCQLNDSYIETLGEKTFHQLSAGIDHGLGFLFLR